MARPAPWQLLEETYPYRIEVPPRYADLDPMGHINNVAIASMFETGRIAFHHQLQAHPKELGVRWLVAAVNLNYLREMHAPCGVSIASGLHRLGNRSWTILSAAFQEGDCCATCETVMVMEAAPGRGFIGETLRRRMSPFFVKEPEAAESA
ncbi:MAG: acyl-CoA thioesterase [Sphingobium sp.]